MAIVEIDLDAEQAAFEKEVYEVEAWWKTPRHAALRRPYSAKRVVMLRHSQRRQYASSTQALKLWNMLQENLRNETYELTYGATDPVVIGQMAKYQKTVYVSGALCGTTRVMEPGIDHADYPWDTVPKIIDHIYHSQMWNDQRQRHLRMSRSREERAQMPFVDHLAPIIADGDMGFGGLTSTIKMAKAFVEAGVAMIHVDDLASGMKRFTIGQGRTLVPISEYESRLCAVRMQFDIMGADTMLLLRSDCIKAEFITSCIDPRDHEYIVGATQRVEPFITAMTRAIESSETNPVVVRKQWAPTAGLMTFDEAVKAQAGDEGKYRAYIAEISKTAGEVVSLAQRREMARQALGKDVQFDWELPRSLQGQYAYKWSVKAATERCLAAAPYGDLSWPRMDFPDENIIREIHDAVRLEYPNRMFGYGYSNTYDWEGKGFSYQDIKEFPSRMAKHGAVFQIQPTWAIQGIRHYADQCASILHRDGIAGYYEEIQKVALGRPRIAGDSGLELSGAFLADAFFETIGARDTKYES